MIKRSTLAFIAGGIFMLGGMTNFNLWVMILGILIILYGFVKLNKND